MYVYIYTYIHLYMKTDSNCRFARFLIKYLLKGRQNPRYDQPGFRTAKLEDRLFGIRRNSNEAAFAKQCISNQMHSLR